MFKNIQALLSDMFSFSTAVRHYSSVIQAPFPSLLHSSGASPQMLLVQLPESPFHFP